MPEVKKNTENADTLNIQPTEATQMLDMPCILQETLSTLGVLHPNAAKICITGIILAKTFQLISVKRCCFQEFSNTKPKLLNWFQINFMPSGKGKDKISDDLDDYFFVDAMTYCQKLVLEHKNLLITQIEQQAAEKYPDENQEKQKKIYIKKEIEKIRNIVMELSNATPEGLYADAEALKDAKYGSIFVKYSEFGLMLQNCRQDDLLTLNALFEAYDSRIHSKSTKFDKRKETIENVPINMLAHSDPTLFKKDVKDPFSVLLQTGLVRRAVITFQGNNSNFIEADPIKALKTIEQGYSRAGEISKEFISIFEQIPANAIYKLTDDTYTQKFHPYRIKLAELSNSSENELLNKEIESRQLKVLKLSGMFASLNHPTELVINETDMQQAIYVVEMLSKDLPKFLSYRPKTADCYEKLFNFFHENLGKSYTKTQIITRCRDFGLTRKPFRDNFDETIEIVKEIAADKGYCLVTKPINNNSGIEAKLIKTDNVMPAEIKPLGEIINVGTVNAVNPVKAN